MIANNTKECVKHCQDDRNCVIFDQQRESISNNTDVFLIEKY